MRKRKRSSFIKTFPAWATATLTGFLSPFLIFIFAGLLSLLGFSEVDFTALLVYGISVAVMCFLICRHHPKSFWYVPIISNITSVFVILFESKFWVSDMWIAFSIGWALSIIAVITASFIIKRPV